MYLPIRRVSSANLIDCLAKFSPKSRVTSRIFGRLEELFYCLRITSFVYIGFSLNFAFSLFYLIKFCFCIKNYFGEKTQTKLYKFFEKMSTSDKKRSREEENEGDTDEEKEKNVENRTNENDNGAGSR